MAELILEYSTPIRTADGSRWHVVMEKTADGYKVTSAEPVKSTP